MEDIPDPFDQWCIATRCTWNSPSQTWALLERDWEQWLYLQCRAQSWRLVPWSCLEDSWTINIRGLRLLNDAHKNAVSIAIDNLKRIDQFVCFEIGEYTLRHLPSPFFRWIDHSNSLETFQFRTESSDCWGTTTFSRVSRPLCTMLSAISTAGIRPE